MTKTTLYAILLGLTGAAALAHADGERKRPCHPPPEAIEACDGASSGDACSFTAPDGDTIRGTCWKPDDAPADAPLACAPNDAR
jgi:hypothetical protein